MRNENRIVDLTCGSQAFIHLEPYVPGTSDNFELPVHIGRLISSWDSPKFMPVEMASHMRDDDYVVGMIHKGVARAYPLWITDNYHVINDMIDEDAIVFTTCERCQSGSAFHATLEGRRVKFSGVGMYNASLTMMNRARSADANASLWLHYEGIAIHGKFTGTFLSQIPTYHTTWKDWKVAHPETDVMAVPAYRYHRDARHGHGREEYFSRPGMEPPLVLTITGNLDDRYPENEMVLGINVDQGLKAYPLREVKKSGGIVEDDIGDHPIVVLAGLRPEQFTMAAYSRVVDSRILSFMIQGDFLVDRETETRWTIEGLAVKGPLAKKRLVPLRWQYVRWHAWFYPHRRTELYLHEEKLPIYPEVLSNLDISSFRPVLEAISKIGRQIIVEGAIINLCLPHEARQGVTIRVAGDRLNLYCFKSQAVAEDYVAFKGAWFCKPVGAKVGKKYSCRAGTFVLESDPDVQYADAAQIVRLPDAEIKWSDLVMDDDLIRVWTEDISDLTDSSEGSFVDLFEYLKRSGYDVVEVAFLPHSQLRVGTTNAVATTINACRFAIYKCENAAVAEQLVSELSHSFLIDRLVFRSIPVDMYRDPHYEIGQYPDEDIHWSKLADDERFVATIKTYWEELEKSENVGVIR